MPFPKNRVRIAGAGFTIFHFGGQPIAFCQEVQHTSPQLVSPPSPIQPMDEPYAVEILVSPAAQPGQLVLNLFELFGSGGKASKAWDRLGSPGYKLNSDPQSPTDITLSKLRGKFAAAVDIVDIVLRQAQVDPSDMQITKVVRPLSTTGTVSNSDHYSEEYHGCVITDVVDGEQVAVGTMQVIKQITVAYRYLTRDGKTSAAFNFRDGALGNLVSGTPNLV